MGLFAKVAAFLGSVIALTATAGSWFGWLDEETMPDSLIK